MLSSITAGPSWGSEDTDAILSCFRTPWTVTHQAPLSLGFSRQDIGVGCHGLLQGTLSNPGIEPVSLAFSALQADSLLLSHWESPSIITQDWYS